MQTTIIITNGCSQGQSCGIGSYVLPQGITKEEFTKYVNRQTEQMKQDKQPVKHN